MAYINNEMVASRAFSCLSVHAMKMLIYIFALDDMGMLNSPDTNTGKCMFDDYGRYCEFCGLCDESKHIGIRNRHNNDNVCCFFLPYSDFSEQYGVDSKSLFEYSIQELVIKGFLEETTVGTTVNESKVITSKVYRFSDSWHWYKMRCKPIKKDTETDNRDMDDVKMIDNETFENMFGGNK